MCLQNFSCKQRCVWNALVNEATKGIPTSALCRMVFYFVTKPCAEHLAKPQRKCLFPLCKFHFLNVVSPQQLLQSLEFLTETNRCILFLGLYQGLEVDLCANSYSSRIFSFVCDLWTGNKKKGFSSCCSFLLSVLWAIYSFIFVTVSNSSWRCSQVQEFLLISWCSSCLATCHGCLLLEVTRLLWDVLPALMNPIGILDYESRAFFSCLFSNINNPTMHIWSCYSSMKILWGNK